MRARLTQTKPKSDLILLLPATGNLTHSVDERIRRKAVLLNGCSIYAVHFS
eukprot:COSAG06_NODE_49017_length_328_cov_0.834061_1_plen_50_part_01